MGGTIEVHSRKYLGSAFDVRIPFQIDPDRGRGVAKTRLSGDEIRGKKLLLVEDNELNQEIARFMLMEAGAEVESVWNGKEAVEAVRRNLECSEKESLEAGYERRYDAILMDIMMPVMNGYDSARKIRKLEKEAGIHMPIIAMTANAFVEDIVKCKEAGMDEHIAKPLEVDKLLAKLSKYIRKY